MKRSIKILSVIITIGFSALTFNTTYAMEPNQPEPQAQNVTLNTKNKTPSLDDLNEQLEAVKNSLLSYKTNQLSHKPSPLEAFLIELKISLETQIATRKQNNQ